MEHQKRAIFLSILQWILDLTNYMWVFITLSGSFIDPFPLIYTRQPVVASTRFRELPLGPSSRPTKLN